MLVNVNEKENRSSDINTRLKQRTKHSTFSYWERRQFYDERYDPCECYTQNHIPSNLQSKTSISYKHYWGEYTLCYVNIIKIQMSQSMSNKEVLKALKSLSNMINKFQ